MKELDILLERFITKHQQSLSQGSWPELEALLQSEDDLLWDWLQDPASAAESPYYALLRQIRGGNA